MQPQPRIRSLPGMLRRTISSAARLVSSGSKHRVCNVRPIVTPALARTVLRVAHQNCGTPGFVVRPAGTFFQARDLSSTVDAAVLAMPSLSPTMTHGTISLWKASPGTELKAGDVLCEIETDKASVGFEMQETCVLAKILVEAHGPETAVGRPIALTVEDAAAFAEFQKADPATYKPLEGSPEPTAAEVSTVQSSPASAQTTSSGESPKASSTSHQFMPAARHMVESQGLILNGVTGTAKGGRITKGDLLQGMKAGTVTVGGRKHQPAAAAPATFSPATAASSQPAPAAANNSSNAVSSAPVNDRFKDIPNSNMRKVIAKRLTESKATVPHFYSSIEVEIDKLMALRSTMKKEYGQNLSVNDLVIKSAALALRDVPEANAKWNKAAGAIDASSCRSVDISVAVATPSGLITPILTGADKRGLVDINSTVRDLATRARDGKLKPEEYQGGSFSISNLGMYGITSFSAVINPPQACILAVGAGIQRVLPPLPGTERPRVATTVTVQLSADRRVVDEATAAQFLQVFQGYLSNPQAILL